MVASAERMRIVISVRLISSENTAVARLCLIAAARAMSIPSVELWVGCVAGALQDTEYRSGLEAAGFADVTIEPWRTYKVDDAREFLEQAGIDTSGLAEQVVTFAMDDVERNSTRRVVPMCWFVGKWFDEHPEKADLLSRGAAD